MFLLIVYLSFLLSIYSFASTSYFCFFILFVFFITLFSFHYFILIFSFSLWVSFACLFSSFYPLFPIFDTFISYVFCSCVFLYKSFLYIILFDTLLKFVFSIFLYLKYFDSPNNVLFSQLIFTLSYTLIKIGDNLNFVRLIVKFNFEVRSDFYEIGF